VDFQKQEAAPQRFVSDADASVAKAYGVDIHALGRTVAKRVSYVVGKDGKILLQVNDPSPLSNVNKTLTWLQAHPQNNP